MQADGRAEQAWSIAASPRHRIDLLRAAAKLPPGPALESVRGVLAPIVAASAGGSGPARPAPGVAGRYLRLVRPGRGVVLSVTEVEVRSGGQNIARTGTASQSTVVAGGATGGHAARAIDGGVDMAAVAGTDPLNGTHAFTRPETDPWWEVDLGAERPIESIALWPAAPETRNGYYVAILDANRKVVFVRDGLRLAAAPETITLGGDLSVPLATAAIALLPQFKGHEAESVQTLSAFMRQPVHRQAAMAAIRRLPPNAVPATDVAAIGEQVLTHVRAIPPADRTGTGFLDAVGFGHELSARMPAGERQAFTRALDELVVRVIRIEAVNAQMKFDLSRFTVMAGEEVVIEFVNRDEMPHNLLVTKEGALETVGLAAEAMVSSPDAFGKSFIPNTPEVLFSMRLIQPNETLQARFTAPKQPGSYPFVCTFPGHWRTMNGIVEVTRPPAQVSAQ